MQSFIGGTDHAPYHFGGENRGVVFGGHHVPYSVDHLAVARVNPRGNDVSVVAAHVFSHRAERVFVILPHKAVHILRCAAKHPQQKIGIGQTVHPIQKAVIIRTAEAAAVVAFGILELIEFVKHGVIIPGKFRRHQQRHRFAEMCFDKSRQAVNALRGKADRIVYVVEVVIIQHHMVDKLRLFLRKRIELRPVPGGKFLPIAGTGFGWIGHFNTHPFE